MLIFEITKANMPLPQMAFAPILIDLPHIICSLSNPSLAYPDLQTDCWRSGIYGCIHWSRPAHEVVWPTCQTTNHSSFCSASCFGAWKCRHNNKPVCETLGCILKILWRKFFIFHILLEIQRSIYFDKLRRHICKHDGFLLSRGNLMPRLLCFQAEH